MVFLRIFELIFHKFRVFLKFVLAGLQNHLEVFLAFLVLFLVLFADCLPVLFELLKAFFLFQFKLYPLLLVVLLLAEFELN